MRLTKQDIKKRKAAKQAAINASKKPIQSASTITCILGGTRADRARNEALKRTRVNLRKLSGDVVEYCPIANWVESEPII